MFRNYLKIAYRNLVKSKVYSFINIVGLAIGIAVSVLILMFVMHEFSFDRFHAQHERIFRVMAKSKMGDQDLQTFFFNTQLGPKLMESDPHVKGQVRVRPGFKKVVVKAVSGSSDGFFEENFIYADPSFFTVFSFPLKAGNAAELSKPFTVVISERTAQKYFGNADPIGQTLKVDGKHLMQVVAVAENVPSNSTLTFDFVASLITFPKLSERNRNDWEVAGVFNTYLLLDSENSVAQVERHIGGVMTQTKAFSVSDQYQLEKITSIHLGNNLSESGNTRLINIFIGVAGLILCLALFNYMSLTTARATLRAREVGVRKVVGAGRQNLMQQFYFESAILCAISFSLAFLLVNVLQKPFYNLMDLHIDSGFMLSPFFIGWVVALLIFVSLVAGSYPSVILSGFMPLEVLKGRILGARSGAGVRRFFMVLQFTVSIALIICSLIVKTQLSYMMDKDLGVYKEQVLAVSLTESAGKGLLKMRDEISNMSGVVDVTVANSGLFKPYNMWFLQNQETKKDVGLITMNVDRDFVKTLGLKYQTEPESGVDGNQGYFLLNQVAVKELGLGKSPVGKKLLEKEPVRGVLKDFNFKSLQSNVEALGLYVVNDTTNLLAAEGSQGLMYVRLNPGSDIGGRVEAIGKIFKKYDIEKPFEYYFLNDAFNQTFRTEMRLSKMFTAFTGFAIFIACLGLFGLVTFTAETRNKEIGIRKVLGASVASIVALLSTEFIRLITLAIIIAVPLAWYVMENWLADFPYRIEIPLWIIAVAGIITLVIAICTISVQSIKAALTDPVKSLRSE